MKLASELWQIRSPANSFLILMWCFLFSVLLLFSFCHEVWPQAVLPVDFSSYRDSPDFRVTRDGNILTINWTGESKTSLRLSLNLADPEKLIADLSHAAPSAAGRKVILKDAAPAYRVIIGKRSGG